MKSCTRPCIFGHSALIVHVLLGGKEIKIAVWEAAVKSFKRLRRASDLKDAKEMQKLEDFV